MLLLSCMDVMDVTSYLYLPRAITADGINKEGVVSPRYGQKDQHLHVDSKGTTQSSITWYTFFKEELCAGGCWTKYKTFGMSSKGRSMRYSSFIWWIVVAPRASRILFLMVSSRLGQLVHSIDPGGSYFPGHVARRKSQTIWAKSRYVEILVLKREGPCMYPYVWSLRFCFSWLDLYLLGKMKNEVKQYILGYSYISLQTLEMCVLRSHWKWDRYILPFLFWNSG